MTTTEKTVSWDELYPFGRIVFYEGDDYGGFAAEIKTLYGIDVNAAPPGGWEAWHYTKPPSVPFGVHDEAIGFERSDFFIPAGLVQEIYGGRRWPLGS
jgi:hypothetical protein